MTEKLCWCCNINEATEDSGLCKYCEKGLEQQRETGRCFMCGNLVDECTCE